MVIMISLCILKWRDNGMTELDPIPNHLLNSRLVRFYTVITYSWKYLAKKFSHGLNFLSNWRGQRMTALPPSPFHELCWNFCNRSWSVWILYLVKRNDAITEWRETAPNSCWLNITWLYYNKHVGSGPYSAILWPRHFKGKVMLTQICK